MASMTTHTEHKGEVMTDIGRLKELEARARCNSRRPTDRTWMADVEIYNRALHDAAPHLLSEIETLRARLAAAEWMLRAAEGFVLAAPLKHPQQSEVKASLLEHMREWIDHGKVTICDSAPTEGE